MLKFPILFLLTFFTGKVDRFPEMVDLITGKVDFVRVFFDFSSAWVVL